MKHSIKITIVILLMFIIAQLVGLYVVNFYSPTKVINNVQQNVTTPNSLPFGLEPSPINNQLGVWETLLYIIPSLIIAIALFFLLTRLKASVILKGWFFIVVSIALSVSLISFIPGLKYAWIIALIIAVPLAFFKIYKRNMVVHNLTELLIYPGIAAIFVALLSSPNSPNRGVFAMIAILVAVSAYDMWAVWHSKVMQKMAKYEMNNLKIFGGFLIPVLSKRERKKLKQLRKRIKESKKSKNKKIGLKVNMAILGGGDVAYPLIMAGVVLRRFGFMNVLGISVPLASLIIILGAALGLGLLLVFSSKNKFYPAMPFISAGAFVSLGLCYLFF